MRWTSRGLRRTTTRSTWEILRANLLTPVNGLMAVLLLVTSVFAGWPVIIATAFAPAASAGIGSMRELAVKRQLDRLLAVAPRSARVVRDGVAQSVPVESVRAGDVVRIEAGDHVPVDGRLIEAQYLELDQGLLTGEASPVGKITGDTLLSGSIVTGGGGWAQVTRAGDDTYESGLRAEAAEFRLVESVMSDGIDWFVKLSGWLLIPVAAVVLWGQLDSGEDWREAGISMVAVGAALVPIGLVVLTKVAFATAAFRLGKRGALVQDMHAAEMLAHVDIVCVDKTGTLMIREPKVDDLVGASPAADFSAAAEGEARAALAAIANADPCPNATLQAIADTFPAEAGLAALAHQGFSPHTRFSETVLTDGHTWLLGAPDAVLDPVPPAQRRRASELAQTGRRILLLARRSPTADGCVEPVAYVALSERARPDACAVVEYLAQQGIQVRVISGDRADTVKAAARAVGIHDAPVTLRASDIPWGDSRASEMVEAANCFARVSPGQKRDIVRILQEQGHTVAMIGDGVNDAVALKQADLGIAMASGSDAARAVAPIVLVNDRFESVPSILTEGRRVFGNAERIAHLWITKSVYVLLLALMIAVVGRPTPLTGRQYGLVTWLTIVVPGTFIALARRVERVRPGSVQRILRFAVPAGVIAAGATLFAYELAIHEGVPVIEARTTATTALIIVVLALLAVIMRPLRAWSRILLAACACAFLLLLATPFGRSRFDLDPPSFVLFLATVGIGSIAVAIISAAPRVIGWLRPLQEALRVPQNVGGWTRHGPLTQRQEGLLLGRERGPEARASSDQRRT